MGEVGLVVLVVVVTLWVGVGWGWGGGCGVRERGGVGGEGEKDLIDELLIGIANETLSLLAVEVHPVTAVEAMCVV